MSEPRLVTPLLADHIIGDPISDHNGVRCCPALHKESEEKYIVKIISTPASQSQLDALLLSGAYSSPEEARQYFHTLAQEVLEEARTLQKLSRLEGFRGYEGWQLEPAEDGTGYEIYLLGRYVATLDRHLRNEGLTHLAAVNLGLDLCAALSVSRRNGWLYVDLKPENIILSETKGYQIADLGFVSLRSLKYASLPEKYRSIYTAPEILDAYSTLNPTLDIYALGKILIQVYNGGILPEESDADPVYADPDMTQILRKACAEDPADRWQDPGELAQALVNYMHTHSVNDTPIIPLPEPEPVTEEAPAEDPAPDTVNLENDSTEIADSAPIVEEAIVLPPISAPEVEEVQELSTPEQSPEDLSDDTPESPAEVTVSPEPAESDDIPAQTPQASDEPEQTIIDGFLFDESDHDVLEGLENEPVSEDISQILAQADALLAHKTPDPVVAPEPIEVPMPEPILPEPEPEPEPESEPVPADEPTEASPEASEIPEPVPNEAAPAEPAEDTATDPVAEAAPKKRFRAGCLIGTLLLILLLCLAGIGCKYYYDNIYLQNVATISVEGAEDHLTVTLDTQIDNTLLTVTCTDTYGTRLTQPVIDNRAVFHSLPAGTSFQIQVHISGRHRLTGALTASYTSSAQTSIKNLWVSAGNTDGSVNLSFSVIGPDSESGWLVKYSTEGGAEQTATCASHTASITGLEVGKTYTFRLVPKDPLYLVGTDSIDFTALAVVMPENLTIHGFENGNLIADWTYPEETPVNSWTVRCFGGTYDATFTVTQPSISIPDLDITQGYTLEVKAEGMPEGGLVSISANSVTFKEPLFTITPEGALQITWHYEGTAPADGWQLMYTTEHSAAVYDTCYTSSYILENPIPGETYTFTLLLPDGISQFGGTGTYTVPQAPLFSGYDIDASVIHPQLCIHPCLDGWTHADIGQDGYSSSFYVGQKIGCVIALETPCALASEEITVTWILRSADGTFLAQDVSTALWDQLWIENYCYLDIPFLPEVPGEYTLELLFNRACVTTDTLAMVIYALPAEEPANSQNTDATIE